MRTGANNKAKAIKRLIIFVCLSALAVSMIFRSLIQGINQDEEAFIAPAYLAQHMQLYVDFLYMQSPIYPLVLSKLLMPFQGERSFLIARLLSAFLAIGSVTVFFALASRLSKSTWFAYGIASLFASAPLMLWAYGSARNDIMPIFFGLCGVRFALAGLDTKRNPTSSFLAFLFAGFFMGIAVGTKATAAFIPLSATLYLFLRAKRWLLPLIIGGAIGAIPIMYYAAIDLDKFLFCNAGFHFTIFRDYYIDHGFEKIFALPFRIKVMLKFWTAEPTLILATLFIAFVLFVGVRWGLLRQLIQKDLHPDRAFIFILTIAAIPFVFLPVLEDKQYLQPALPYLLLTCAALFPLAQRIFDRVQMQSFVALAAVVLALQIGQFARLAVDYLSPSRWTVNRVHYLSALIARHVKKGTVATLYPAIVLDAGTHIYPQFATGVFFFRSGDHLTPRRVIELNGTSPNTLSLLLKNEPPAAVFTGSTPVDAPLLNWARRHCYVEADLSSWKGGLYPEKYWTPHLFIRPHQPQSC